MATRAEIGDLLQVLHALYPHSSPMPKGLSEQALVDAVARVARPWHTILGDLPVEVLSLAVKELASSNREFLPPAGVVRQAALDLMGAAGAEKTVGEAWEEVRLAMSRGEHAYRKGYYEWSSDLVERAFNGIGGWHYFSTALMDSVMADRRAGRSAKATSGSNSSTSSQRPASGLSWAEWTSLSSRFSSGRHRRMCQRAVVSERRALRSGRSP